MLQALTSAMLGSSNLSLYQAALKADANGNDAGASVLESLQGGNNYLSMLKDLQGNSGNTASSQADVLGSLLTPASDGTNTTQPGNAAGDLAELEGLSGSSADGSSLQDAAVQALMNSDANGSDIASVLNALNSSDAASAAGRNPAATYNADGSTNPDTSGTSGLFSATA
jgi:hypothetical protein